MAWITPVAWSVPAPVGNADFDRIEGNLDYIRNMSGSFFGNKTFNPLVAAPSLTLNYTLAGTGGNYIEFSKVGHTAKGSLGALGNFEMNMSYNMDYADGVHRYYDSTKNAIWSAMQTGGYFLQFAPAGYVDPGGAPDMWTGTGYQVILAIKDTGYMGVGLRPSTLLPLHAMDIYAPYAEQFKIMRNSDYDTQFFTLDVGGGLADYRLTHLDGVAVEHRWYSTNNSTNERLLMSLDYAGMVALAPGASAGVQIARAPSNPSIKSAIGTDLILDSYDNSNAVYLQNYTNGDVILANGGGQINCNSNLNPTTTPTSGTWTTSQTIPRGIYNVKLYSGSDTAKITQNGLEIMLNSVGNFYANQNGGAVISDGVNTTISLSGSATIKYWKF